MFIAFCETSLQFSLQTFLQQLQEGKLLVPKYQMNMFWYVMFTVKTLLDREQRQQLNNNSILIT